MCRRFNPYVPLLCATLGLLSAGRAETRPATTSAAPVSFVNDVIPVLTKSSCNMGACHAKAIVGQRGFRLSLLGFEPQEDYEHIVKEGKGRRVFPPAPEQSLLLLKAANIVPHGGGEKLKPGSAGYQTLVRWISQGMPFGAENERVLESLEVLPKRLAMKINTKQALKVTAKYSDGSTRDVTKLALYEANDREMAEANETGVISTRDLPGNAAVMVRYGGKVAVCSVSIPLGAPVPTVPPVKNFIDELVFANLKAIGVPPSPVCDDATFLRRVSLDIAGRLPTAEETSAFLANPAADKRDQAIDVLLTSPDYADYFANKWTALLKNKREEAADITANFAFHSWVRDGMLANKPYDEMVRQILAATGTIVANPAVAWYKRVKEPNAQLEDVAQLFLGVRMQCAQCHHHPFERWSQNDYYSMAAYFGQVGRKPTAIAGEDLIFHKRGVAQLENKRTGQMVKPAGLGQAPQEIAPDDDPRLQLANWMADTSNPFFAKALVNRYWKHFFNRGLVEPEDDLRDTNPASNPELLDLLAKHFVESGFDLKALIRELTTSKTYQLSAIPNAHNQSDRQNFSRYYPKRLPAEVLFDGLNALLQSKSNFAGMPSGTRAIDLPDNSFNKDSYFLNVFGRPESSSACECERTQDASMAQALHLLNAKDIQQKLTADQATPALWAADSRPNAEILRELYLAAYARQPEPAEMDVALAHLAKPRYGVDSMPLAPLQARRQAFEDILWVILNTKEFLFNH
jgi:hypothetical protein